MPTRISDRNSRDRLKNCLDRNMQKGLRKFYLGFERRRELLVLSCAVTVPGEIETGKKQCDSH